MREILAPAGNIDCARAAINGGADAIYIGFSAFSARMNAENFDLSSLQALIREAHTSGVRVYVAMNTLILDEELDEFLNVLLAVWERGADAIIMQDIFLGKAVREKYPEITLHLSTQAGVCNVEGAKLAKECGFSRVILARETRLADIREISQIVETEVFAQGALCTAFSGQCYMSSFAGGNSGNRGRCKQPCRKLYQWDRSDFEEKAYALSLSDLCVGEDIEKYLAAGVVSFKIEGRMRRAEYVAASVAYYRAVLDNRTEKEKERGMSALKRTFNRGNYTKGLAFGQDKRFLSRAVQGHIGEKVGVVKVVNGNYFVESGFVARKGDAFKVLRSGKELGGAFFQKTEKRGFSIQSKTRLMNGDGVFVTTDSALNERLLQSKKLERIAITLSFEVGKQAVARYGEIEVYSEEPLTAAQSRPLSVEEIRACFEKTDGLPFSVTFDKIELTGDVFFAKSRLNAFRRAFFDRLVEARQTQRDTLASLPFDCSTPNGRNDKTAVLADDFLGVTADIAIYKPNDLKEPLPKSFLEGDFEKYLYYPAYLTGDELVLYGELVKGLDGIYAENYGGVIFAREHGVKLFAGTGFNLTNAVAIDTLKAFGVVAYYALSKELPKDGKTDFRSSQAFALSSGDLKVMELCYCPFEKTCAKCDKKKEYILTDENGRAFTARRYERANGCRFEIFNCARLLGEKIDGVGRLIDLTTVEDKATAVAIDGNVELQKKFYPKYTFGHTKNNRLL